MERKMCRGLECMALLLLILAPFHTLPAKGEECSYLLEVQTSYSFLGSETDDPVRVRFGDKGFYEENKVEVLERHLSQSMNEGNKKPFRWGSTDKFNLTGPCVKDNLCYVYFKVEGTDGWRVNDAIVHHNYGKDTFHFNKKLPENTWDGPEYCNANSEMIASLAATEDAVEQVDKNGKRKSRKIKVH
ncbi:hypothetical protein SUGI_0461290 [Cryptomeria japonica]|uniref:embryo-specific protein ATS3A n=1 Tax=Cryptomeria japonica TaxID=3369 RepID=UPI0024089EAC|nr:embryo-specific protein ATS3A [Cryptomeria japonica]GLJ24184.1 hypothetical protein SUGI_0461290 [Cryptomeria japonica]